MQDNIPYRAGLYLRLSKDDDLDGESLSISTQRSILTDYCAANGYMVFGIQVGGIIRGDKSSPLGGVVPGVAVIQAGIIDRAIAREARMGTFECAISTFLFYHLLYPPSSKSLPGRNDLGGWQYCGMRREILIESVLLFYG